MAKKKAIPTPEQVLMRLGPYVRQRRLEKRLSLRALQDLCGVPHTSLFQLELEGKDPRLSELMLVGGAFGEGLEKFLRPIL